MAKKKEKKRTDRKGNRKENTEIAAKLSERVAKIHVGNSILKSSTIISTYKKRKSRSTGTLQFRTCYSRHARLQKISPIAVLLHDARFSIIPRQIHRVTRLKNVFFPRVIFVIYAAHQYSSGILIPLPSHIVQNEIQIRDVIIRLILSFNKRIYLAFVHYSTGFCASLPANNVHNLFQYICIY